MGPLYTGVDKDNTLMFPEFEIETCTFEDIAKALKNSGDLKDQELEKMIRKNYSIFLDEKYLLDYNFRQAVIDVFSNKRFLKALIKILSYEVLSDKIITCCNKVTWDYMTQVEKDKETGDLLLQLSNTVNYSIVNMLSAYIPVRLAQLIALARYSSFKIEKNINRANAMIVKYAKGIDVQTIVNIYGIIFRHTRLSIVFSTIMMDSEKPTNDEELERYALISTAILEILEHGMSSQDIMTILKAYSNNLVYSNKSPRFSMYSNSQIDYQRIYAVLDALSNNNVDIP